MIYCLNNLKKRVASVQEVLLSLIFCLQRSCSSPISCLAPGFLLAITFYFPWSIPYHLSSVPGGGGLYYLATAYSWSICTLRVVGYHIFSLLSSLIFYCQYWKLELEVWKTVISALLYISHQAWISFARPIKRFERLNFVSLDFQLFSFKLPDSISCE